MERLQEKISKRLEEGLQKQENLNPKEVIVASLFNGILHFSIIETLEKNGNTYFAEIRQSEVMGFNKNDLEIDFCFQVAEEPVIAKDFGTNKQEAIQEVCKWIKNAQNNQDF